MPDGLHIDGNGNLWMGSTSNTFDSAANFYVQTNGTMHAEAGDIGGIELGATFIQSSNYSSSGSGQGFRLNSDGTAVFNGTVTGLNFLSPGDAANDINNNSTTISGGKITAGTLSVTNADISGTLDFSKITQNSVNIIEGMLQNGAVTTDKISDGSVTNVKLGNISADKITSGTINATFIGGGVLDMNFNINGLNLNADHSMSAGGKIEATGSASLTDAGDVIARGNVQTGDRLEHYGATSTTYIDIGQTSSFFLRPNGTSSGVQFSGTGGQSYIRSSFRPNLNNTYGLGSSVYKWTDVWAVDGTINTSDITLKTDVEATTLGLDFIDTLTPIEFKWADGGVRTHLGFSAQDVKQKLIDAKGATQNYAMYVQGSYDTQNDEVDEEGNLVEEIPEDFETYGLRPQELIPVLVKAIQELSAKNDGLESRIEALES